MEAAVENSRSEIEQAVDGLRRAGQQQYIPSGLLTRAWLHALTGDDAGERQALAEDRRLIEKHGYGRRLEELADTEEAAKHWGG